MINLQLVRLDTTPKVSSSEGLMYLVWIVVAVLFVVVMWRRTRRAPSLPSGQRYFVETPADGWFEINAPPSPPATPYSIVALIPAAIAAAAVTFLWILAGHDFESSAWVFWLALIATVPLFRHVVRARDHRVRSIQPGPFAVGGGMVRLPDGRELLISGQFVVTRRNSAPDGHSATAHAHHVDLEFDGMCHTLAGGLSDPASMAVYHQVMRRLKGEA